MFVLGDDLDSKTTEESKVFFVLGSQANKSWSSWSSFVTPCSSLHARLRRRLHLMRCCSFAMDSVSVWLGLLVLLVCCVLPSIGQCVISLTTVLVVLRAIRLTLTLTRRYKSGPFKDLLFNLSQITFWNLSLLFASVSVKWVSNLFSCSAKCKQQ